MLAFESFVTSVVYLVTGLYVLKHFRGDRRDAWAYSLWLFFTVHWQLVWAVNFAVDRADLADFFCRAAYSGIVFLPIAFFHFITSFLNTRSRRYAGVLYLVGAAFCAAAWTPKGIVAGYYRYDWGYYPKAGPLHPLFLVFLTAIVIVLLVELTRAEKREVRGTTRHTQVRLLKWAFACYLPGALDFRMNYGINVYPIGFVFTLACLFLVSYAVVRHEFLNLRPVIRTTILYSALTVVLTTVYAGAVILTAWALEGWVRTPRHYSSVIAAFAVAILVQPVRRAVQRWLDRHFPREALDPVLLREAAGGFVHEMRRPLARMSLPAQLALQDLEALARKDRPMDEVLPRVMDRLRFIVAESAEAGETIEALRDLLSAGHAEAGVLAIGPLLQKLAASEMSRHAAVRIELVPAVPLDGVMLRCHPKQIEIALANVLKNAVEAALSQGTSRVVVLCQFDPSDLTIRFQNPGVKAEGRAFESPYSSTKGRGGMGIGLALVREIVRIHHGSFRAETEGDVEVWLTLPRQGASPAPTHE